MGDFLNIKTKGYNETIIRNNSMNNVSKLNWDADYDGENGKVSLDYSENGKPNEHVKISFNNDDLVNLLNVPSINMPIHERLKNDFMKTKRRGTRKNNNSMIVELMKSPQTTNTFDNILEPIGNTNTLPSNMSQDVLIPLINTTRKKRHRKGSKKMYIIKRIKSPKTNTRKGKSNYKYLVAI